MNIEMKQSLGRFPGEQFNWNAEGEREREREREMKYEAQGRWE